MIDVSAHRMDRRQLAEPRNYARTANIPGMNDGIAVGKCRERLRPQQAMSIGNRANGLLMPNQAKLLTRNEPAPSCRVVAEGLRYDYRQTSA